MDWSGQCFRCGVCCTRYQVNLSLVEARRISDGLGISWDEFQKDYLDQRWLGYDSFLLRRHNGVCIFLQNAGDNGQASCLVHSSKPTACRLWTPGPYQRECQIGLVKYWNLIVSPSGKIQGTNEATEHFESFLKSLVDAGNDAHLRV